MLGYKDRHHWTSHNWLVHRIHDAALAEALQKYASGVLADIGCGQKPYAPLVASLTTTHLGIDHPATLHNTAAIDIYGTAYATGLAAESVDTVMSTFVWEHLEEPQQALREAWRILRPGGHIILSAPLFWHLHEQPRDFYRYTRYGWEHMLTATGFEVVAIRPLAGFVVTFGQEMVYPLQRLRRGPLKPIITLLQATIQGIAYSLNKFDRSFGFTWAYLVVAQKPGGTQ